MTDSAALDRERFSLIAHGDLPLWNPVGLEVLDAWLAALPPGGEALDVGCGRGELLVRLALAKGSAGLGIDSGEAAIRLAREAARARAPAARLEFRCERFDSAALPAARFDLVACIGATHAVGDFESALGRLTPLVRPGGRLWLGEGYWRREPPEAYLRFLGASPGDLRSHAGNLALARRHGLRALRDHEADAREWSAYEDRYAANVERFLASHPDDPEADAMRARIRGWRDAYLRWGRDTLGFGLYLWELPR